MEKSRVEEFPYWTQSKLIGGWIFAACLVLGNHFFFTYLDGKSTDIYPQFLINASKNTIATATQLTLVVVQEIALLQMLWLFVRGRQLSISRLDDIFSLPSARALLNLTIRMLFGPLFPLLAVSAISISMALLPILVPGSLSTEVASMASKSLLVPSVDLSTDSFGQIAVFVQDHTGRVGYAGPTPLLRRMAESTIGGLRPIAGSPPADCRFQCEYNTTFNAIALQCSDLNPSDIWTKQTPPTKPPAIFLQDAGGQGATYLYNTSFGIDFDSSDFIFNFTLGHRGAGATEPAGSICTFHNATYNIFNKFSNFTQSSHVSAIAITSKPLRTGTIACDQPNPFYPSHSQFTSCDFVRFNGVAVMEAFARAMSGTIYQNRDYHQFATFINSDAIYPLASLFSVNCGSTIHTCDFGLSNSTKEAGLSRALESLFANVTTSLFSPMLQQDSSFQTVGLVQPFASQYQYNRIPLLATYGTALLLSALSIALGVFSRLRNGFEGGKDFSDFLITTRNPALDKLATKNEDGLAATKLQYGKWRYFYSNASQEEEEVPVRKQVFELASQEEEEEDDAVMLLPQSQTTLSSAVD